MCKKNVRSKTNKQTNKNQQKYGIIKKLKKSMMHKKVIFKKVWDIVHQTSQENNTLRENTGQRKHNLCSQTQHSAVVEGNIDWKVPPKMFTTLTLLLLNKIIFLS